MDPSVCGTMIIFTCRVHIDSICIHARFRVCSSLLAVDSGALLCGSLGQYWLSLHKAAGPNYTLAALQCGMRQKGEKHSEIPHQREERVRLRRWRAPRAPSPAFLLWLASWGSPDYIPPAPPPSLCFVARETHTHTTCLQKEKVNTQSTRPAKPSGCISRLPLSSCMCVCASRRRTFTPEKVSRGKIVLLFFTQHASQFLEAVRTFLCLYVQAAQQWPRDRRHGETFCRLLLNNQQTLHCFKK